MEPITYYIYEIPGKKVGCTKNLKKRLAAQKALDNYRVIVSTTDVGEASELEKFWQLELGYRVDTERYIGVASRFSSTSRTMEHKKAISEARKGMVFSEEHRQNISKAKKGVSIANKGKVHSEEHRRANSESKKGEKNWRYGKGRVFKELSTGFIGDFSAQKLKFGIGSSYLVPKWLGITRKAGKQAGKTWIIISE